MNDKLDYYEIEVGQSNKGYWYCKSLKICNGKIVVIGQELEELIHTIEEKLNTANKEEE